MSGMSIAQAQASLRTALGQMEEIARMQSAVYAQVQRVEERVNSVKASGIAPDTMPSLLALMAEYRRRSEEQRARAVSIVQGISAVMG